MDNVSKKKFIFSDINTIPGVGQKLSKILKKKGIEKVKDLLWQFPYSSTDRTIIKKINNLEIGKIFTVKVKVKKYNFPRVRNLPNKIICEDETGKIDIVYFNSREGYLRKVFQIGSWVAVSGKIGFYKGKYQITNPDYISDVERIDYVLQKIPKYYLTEGLNEKKYRKIIEHTIKNLPEFDEWIKKETIQKYGFESWKSSMIKIHKNESLNDKHSKFYRRISYDEILSNLFILLINRSKINKVKKTPKKFNEKYQNELISSLKFDLTNDQKSCLADINNDLRSNNKMFRLLHGDVGSGKTIVSLIACLNTAKSGQQSALMAPTEILAKQHFNLASDLLSKFDLKVSLITGKTKSIDRKKILSNLENGKINLLIGTHALFQTSIVFKKLGLAIVDEQHKFGVKQRINLSKKGGDNCDVLSLTATPIPRSMLLSIYGDMDVSKLNNKPKNRKDIITITKSEEKLNEVYNFLKKEINKQNQAFWICPLKDQSNFLDWESAKKKYEILNEKFPNKVGLIHGSLKNDEKNKVLELFKEKKIKILVSTTVIEVGIDFPAANIIIIENSNKFGLAQLHQLRGRVGRGSAQGACILIFDKKLNDRSKKRLKILKSTNDGFLIAEEDMKLRGFGDILGYQQSGEKIFKIADPELHHDLFEDLSKNISYYSKKGFDNRSLQILLKLFDRVSLINLDY